MRFQDAKEFVQGLHDEYWRLVNDGDDENTAMWSVLDGLDNEDLLKVLWGCGVVRHAFDACHEDIEQVIYEG